MPDPQWTFPGCPEPPDWTLDWEALLRRFAWLRALEGTPQEPDYHAEGDVLTHTRMVAEALIADGGWRALEPERRSVLFAAALLHDVAKPACTQIAADGGISSPGHARAGSTMAREILTRGEGFADAVPFPAARGGGAARAIAWAATMVSGEARSPARSSRGEHERAAGRCGGAGRGGRARAHLRRPAGVA